MSNKVKQPIFFPILEVACKNDLAGALSIIPPKIFMVQDIRRCCNWNIGAIVDMEMREAYEKLCENGVLKEEY